MREQEHAHVRNQQFWAMHSKEFRVYAHSKNTFIPKSSHPNFFPEIQIEHTQMTSTAWQTPIQHQFSLKHTTTHESNRNVNQHQTSFQNISTNT